jgi:E3 ubiquitin-protein ligase UBR2
VCLSLQLVRIFSFFFFLLFFSGCFLPPPYVDAYGETDQGLRRGDPLHICDASRRKLELLWRSHGLYNEAAKYMENSQALVVTEWHHL